MLGSTWGVTAGERPGPVGLLGKRSGHRPQGWRYYGTVFLRSKSGSRRASWDAGKGSLQDILLTKRKSLPT
jgi:hypothetical protein